LYKACSLFTDLKLPLQLRKFASGVIVVQLTSFDDTQTAQRIATLVKEKGPLTPFLLAKYTNISIALAKEQLLTAEGRELLCRDDSVEGLCFYLNFFLNEEYLKM